MSSTEVQSGIANNLFPSVNQDSLSLNSIDYLCIFLHNTDPSTPVSDLQVWLGPTSNPNFSIALANDNAGPTIASSVSPQADQVPTRYFAPENVGYFIFPGSQIEALPLPDLAPNYCTAVWLQRTLLYSGPIESEQITLFLSGAVM